jgi:hypothetical protein
MKSLISHKQIILSIKSLAGFKSCFGKIGHFEFSLPYSMAPASIDDADLHDIPIFHVNKVQLSFHDAAGKITEVESIFHVCDHMFLAFMESCHSIKRLVVNVGNFGFGSKHPHRNVLLRSSTLPMFAYMNHRRHEPLSSIIYPYGLNLDELKTLSFIIIPLHSFETIMKATLRATAVGTLLRRRGRGTNFDATIYVLISS